MVGVRDLRYAQMFSIPLDVFTYNIHLLQVQSRYEWLRKARSAVPYVDVKGPVQKTSYQIVENHQVQPLSCILVHNVNVDYKYRS